MTGLRSKPPSYIGGNAVLQLKDFKNRTTLSVRAGTKTKDIDLPPSNVLQFLCDDLSIITARPSGTEPKIKFYASCRGPAGMPFIQALELVGKKIVAIKLDLNRIIAGVSL